MLEYRKAPVVPGRFYAARLILYPVGVVLAALGFIAMLIGSGFWYASIAAPHLVNPAAQFGVGGFVVLLIGGSLFFVCGGAYD